MPIGRILVILAMLLCAPAFAQPVAPPTTPITIGQTHLVTSPTLGEREVNVYLPPEYDDGAKRYPVLYLIDGALTQDFLHVAGTTALNALWNRSQPVIVVGIETVDRRAELIGSPGNEEERELFPTAGNSEQFREFLRDAVKPLVERAYRTTGDDAVIGESLAGLFIVETWLRSPELFDRYAAINPSLWWNDIALGEAAAELVEDGERRGPIYLTYSNEGPMTQKGAELVAQAAGEAGCLVPRPDLTHATAYHILTPQALQFLFPTGAEFESEWGFETPCEN